VRVFEEAVMSEIKTSHLRGLVVLVVLLTALAVGTTTALAATSSKNGKAVTAVRTVADNSLTSTNSAALVDMPGMATTVNVRAGQKALLVITFSGMTLCTNTDKCFVAITVDGTIASPGSVQFDGEEGGVWEAGAMQWVVENLAPGQHPVKVKWAVAAPGQFFTSVRTLTVLRSKQ
jgi:cytosine/uracil/thiamine/allantoin permease